MKKSDKKTIKCFFSKGYGYCDESYVVNTILGINICGHFNVFSKLDCILVL